MSASRLRVEELRDGEEPAWDEYVEHSHAASPYHLTSWKRVMDRAYGYRSHYLMAKAGGQIEGVLPLFELKSRILGHSLTTPPGGLCADNEEAAVTLIERAKELTDSVNAKHLALRDSQKQWNGGLVSVSEHCTMIRDLPSQIDVLWKSLDNRLRRHIRLAREGDLQVSMGGGEYLADFYAVYSAFVRDIGTPTFGGAFLRNVVEEFGDRFLISCVRWQGKLIGAYSAFLIRDSIVGAWGGALHDYLDRRPNHIIYWQYMEYGCEHGYSRIDLGRSPVGSGHFQFKKGWGAQPRPLYQQYYLNGVSQPPAIGGSLKEDAKYRLFVNLWRRMPLLLTEALGPQLRKRVPFG
ncbi:MAG: FemAB family PEP-CTERM system-associated protein [Anaerolineae bacterium]|nr:FemAB family PEP-CTERM system-associated protein [Anaerolineae bacterium]